MTVIAPKKFVGLHAHSTFSTGDGLGRPEDHIDYAIKNGMDAMALTDHGNMNAFSHQYLYWEKLKKNNSNFKSIFGVEAYFVPSLADWSLLYSSEQDKKQQEKFDKKKLELQKKIDKFVGNISANEEDAEAGEGVIPADQDMAGDTGVENEEESKSNKWKNPLYQRNHLVLLPKNNEGLKALFKCISHSFIDGFYRFPRMDFDLLEKNAKGNIIGLTACVGGLPSKIIFDNQLDQNWENFKPNDDNLELIQKQLAEMVAKFQQVLGPENFNLELQFNRLGAQHLTNYHLIECSRRTGTPLVVTVDSHYSDPGHWREREIYRLMARQTFNKEENKELDIPKSVDELKCELYPKNVDQLWDSYKTYSKDFNYNNFYDDQTICDAIERTHDIAHNQIGKIEADRKVKLPSILRLVEQNKLAKLYKELEGGTDEDDLAFAQLKDLVLEGAKTRGISDKVEYVNRLRTELVVVKKLKFAKYFLTYHQIMKVVGEECLFGPARGSAAGSLLAYVLDITQIDPIKHGLLFERFLTSYKTSYPDIDTDVSDRDKALDLLAEYFGQENVIAVSNFNQLQMRSLIKDACRVNGVSFAESNAATKKIEAETKAAARKEPGFDATQWFLTYEAAERDSRTFRELVLKYPEFEKMIKVLFKNNRNISRHAGGVILADKARDNMPIVKSGGVLQTPWTEGSNYRHLESFGFLKFDILGLGTLRMFEACIRRILKKQGIKYPTFKQVKQFYYDNLHSDNNDMDDMKVYKNVYWKSNYAGIFQFVRPQVQKMMAKMRPKSVKDIAIITSLFRPGPLSVSADKQFLQNRRDPDSIVYKHPLLKEVLEDTSGLIIFQEQLQLIYHKLAGVPLEQTDNIRKAFTKKEISNMEQAELERQKLRQDFIEKCKEANDIAPHTSGDIFDEMEKYVKYSFNLSHAISYGAISYYCAWFLTYHPDEWIATYIDYCTDDKGKVTGYEDPKAVALGEAKGLGYEIGKADINLSERETVIKEGKVLVPSFSTIKSVGATVQREILQMRPYKTVEDLLWNPDGTWKHSKFNKRAMGALIKLEALDSTGMVGPAGTFKNYKQLHQVVIDNAEMLKRASTRKKNQNHKEVLESLIEQSQELGDWTVSEKMDFCKELLGSVDINLIVPPKIRAFFKDSDIVSIDDWQNGKSVYWAVVQNCQVATAKTGRKYCRAKLIGDSGMSYLCFMWNFIRTEDIIPDNSLVIGNFKKSDFGLSTSLGQLTVLDNGENKIIIDPEGNHGEQVQP